MGERERGGRVSGRGREVGRNRVYCVLDLYLSPKTIGWSCFQRDYHDAT